MLGIVLSAALGLTLIGCDRSTQEKAQEREAEAKQKIQKLGRDAKQEAKKLDHEFSQTVRPERDQAGVKLENAALLTKVKAKLASDVGVATLNDINVDANGSVVTLRGTVATAAKRQQAEHAVSQVSGVTKVIDELKVAP